MVSVKHDDMSNPIEEINPKMGTRSSQDNMKTQHDFTPKDNRFFTTLVMLLVVRDEPEKEAIREKELHGRSTVTVHAYTRSKTNCSKTKNRKPTKPRRKNKNPLNLQ